MKVILISKVANCGNIGDVVEVKNGFARNFLIPKKYAIHYSKANYQTFENKKKEFEAQNHSALENAEKVKDLISGKDIIIIENASDDGRLYGAVNTSMIAAKVNALSANLGILKSNVILEKPIKEIGIYNILINLYADVSAKLRLIVSRTESEAEALLKQEISKSAPKKVSSPKKSGKKKSKSETGSEDQESESEEVINQEESAA